jgi:2-methylisocitrate lyase-like PEP mutase family enzyme
MAGSHAVHATSAGVSARFAADDGEGGETMSAATAQKRAAFRALHESGCFTMPNPWDVGSAVALQSLGFPALASTSAGMAWSLGHADNQVTMEEVLAHLTTLAARVDIPMNADFENGFADAPDGVAANVALAVETGVAGLSVEDSTGDPASPLYDFDLAVARVAAARAAIDASGGGVVLTARSEGFICGRPDLDETLRRLKAFAAVGADCLYAPGLREESQILAVIQAVSPKPVNVLTPGLPAATLAGLGVRRISVGGALARTAWGEFLRSAREIADEGTFTAFAQGAPGGELNRMFAGSDT